MLPWILLSLLITNIAFASVGHITRILGTNDGHIIREQQKMALTETMSLKEGDEIFSMDSVIQLHLYPSTQMNLAKHSYVKITQNLINFNKGIIRLQVIKSPEREAELQILAEGVSFKVIGTEFELSKDGLNTDLDVVKGEVEVSSPYVNTFVPEIVKANEGFHFNFKEKQFQRRKFRIKFEDYPPFMSKKKSK